MCFKLGKDKFLLDRGFVRCKLPYEFVHPALLKSKQFSASDANSSRLATFSRNVVERKFGRLDKWGILRNTLDTNYFPKIGSIFRILCAVDNKYGAPLVEESKQRELGIYIFYYVYIYIKSVYVFEYSNAYIYEYN